MADYSSGDVYHALALHVRPDRRPRPDALEEHNPDERQRMKPLQLGSITGWASRAG